MVADVSPAAFRAEASQSSCAPASGFARLHPPQANPCRARPAEWAQTPVRAHGPFSTAPIYQLLVRLFENGPDKAPRQGRAGRSEEHTYELQSLMRISYAVFCLKK